MNQCLHSWRCPLYPNTPCEHCGTPYLSNADVQPIPELLTLKPGDYIQWKNGTKLEVQWVKPEERCCFLVMPNQALECADFAALEVAGVTVIDGARTTEGAGTTKGGDE